MPALPVWVSQPASTMQPIDHDSTDDLNDQEKDEQAPIYGQSTKDSPLLWQRPIEPSRRPVFLAIAAFSTLLILSVSTWFVASLPSPRSDPATFPYDGDIGKRVEEGLLRYAAKHRKPGNPWARRITQIGEPSRVGSVHPSWQAMNMGWRKELWMHDAAGKHLEALFSEDVPDLVWLYRHVSLPVLRSEIFRDSMLFLQGGIYADIDTECLKPIDAWITPDQWANETLHAVVGIEIDEPDWEPDRYAGYHWTKNYQFANYMMLTKPFSPVPRRSLATKAARILEKAIFQNQTVDNIDWQLRNQSHLSYSSGTAAWTDAILEVINDELDEDLDQRTRWKQDITRAKFPHQLGGVLVLPINSFGGGQGHSYSKSWDDLRDTEEALMHHAWSGSWVDWSSRRKRQAHRHTDIIEARLGR